MLKWLRKGPGDPPKPTWHQFRARFPDEVWRDFELGAKFALGRDASETALRHWLTVYHTAIRDVAGDAAAQFHMDVVWHPMSQLLTDTAPDADRPSYQVAWEMVAAMAPDERTALLVQSLRIFHCYRTLQANDPDHFSVSDVPFPPEATLLRYDHLAFPATLARCNVDVSSKLISSIIRLAEMPLNIDEAMAAELLRMVRDKRGEKYLFAKPLVRHIVAHVRGNPSADYLAAWRAARDYLLSPEGRRRRGPGDHWSQTREHLSKAMERNAAHLP